MARLKEQYKNELKDILVKELEIKNPMLIPALEKIVISVGIGEEGKDNKLLQNIQDTISLIAGQKAVVAIAKKSIAGFKLREDFPVGIKVTLRGDRMYEFLDKLVSISLPKVKDFKGINRNGFDGRGSFNFGLQEQLIFPEVNYDDIIKIHGMNIAIVTSASCDKDALKLLELMKFPFTKGKS